VLENTPILFTGGSGLLALNWAQAMRDRCTPTLGLHERNISLDQTYAKKIDLESVLRGDESDADFDAEFDASSDEENFEADE